MPLITEAFQNVEPAASSGSPSPPLPSPPGPHGRGGVSAMVGGALDAAAFHDAQLALWSPALQSADRDILPEKTQIDARSRDSLRGDAYVQGGANLYKDSIVGDLYALNCTPRTDYLGLDSTWETEFQDEVETHFGLWCESQDNWVDAARKCGLTDLVRMAVGVDLAGGEVLSTVEWIRDGDPRRPFNTAVQMVDTDRLTNPYGQADSDTMRRGVERDRYGAPIAYHIQSAHPTDYTSLQRFEWKRVLIRKPWGRLQVIHLFEQNRPDQSRGISQMAAGLKELRIIKEFRDVALQNAVVQSTYAASIESELPAETVYAQLGGDQTDLAGAIRNYAGSYLDAIAQYSGGAKNLRINGVRIPHLFPGTKLQMRPAGSGGPLGTDFEASLLRYLAAILGVSYEELSKDYTQTNYSSARAAMVVTEKAMRSRKRRVADKMASIIFRLWLEEALNTKQITSMPRNAPSWYEPLNLDAYAACSWIGANRGQIDELKETQAAVLRLRTGLSTQEDELARLGKDWRKVFSQRARELRTAKELQLDFNVDGKTKTSTNRPSAETNTQRTNA